MLINPYCENHSCLDYSFNHVDELWLTCLMPYEIYTRANTLMLQLKFK